MPALDEFAIIEKYFVAGRSIEKPVIFGIGDDCAIVDGNGLQAISVDTSIAGRHFPEDANPSDIAHRALNVSLSDLAAMGAKAQFFTLALTLPSTNQSWLEGFSKGLFEAADYHQVQLIGGDTTKGHLSITIQVNGILDGGKYLSRSGAKINDYIYVSGELGDAGAGLAIYQGKQDGPDDLIQRYLRPQAEIEFGLLLHGVATSCIDISDGLLADLGHILKCSGVAARVDLDKVPMSSMLMSCVSSAKALEYALTAGDDYKLCFTSPKQLDSVDRHRVYCIGRIVEGTGLVLDNQPEELSITQQGYQHFHE